MESLELLFWQPIDGIDGGDHVASSLKCWRSVSVDVLRGLGDSSLSRLVLRGLAAAEDALPGSMGRAGVYPLLVLDKAAVVGLKTSSR